MQWQTFKTVVSLACDKHSHVLFPYLVLIFTPTISLGLYSDSLMMTFVAEHLHTHKHLTCFNPLWTYVIYTC